MPKWIIKQQTSFWHKVGVGIIRHETTMLLANWWFLTEKRADLGHISCTYDVNGNLLAVSDSSETIGPMIRITGWCPRLMSMDERSLMVMESRSYDAAGKLITLAVTCTNHSGEPETIYDYTYSCDDRGNITGLTGKQEELSAITRAAMEYDDQNRLICYNGQTIQYDDRGNLVYGPLKGVMTSFTYDVRKRLIQTGGSGRTAWNNGQQPEPEPLQICAGKSDELQ